MHSLPPETALLLYGRVPSLLFETLGTEAADAPDQARAGRGVAVQRSVMRIHAVTPARPEAVLADPSAFRAEQLWLVQGNGDPSARLRMQGAAAEVLRRLDANLAREVQALGMAMDPRVPGNSPLVQTLAHAADVLLGAGEPLTQSRLDASQALLLLAGTCGRDVGSLVRLALRAEHLADPASPLRSILDYPWLPPHHLSLALRQRAEVALGLVRIYAVPPVVRSARPSGQPRAAR